MVTQLATEKAAKATSAPGEKFVFRTREAAAAAGVSLSKLYLELRAGRLRARKMGGCTVVLREDLMAWLQSLPVKERTSVSHRERMVKEWRKRREAEAR